MSKFISNNISEYGSRPLVNKKDSDFKIFGAKIFDKGFVHWALSQGTAIEILEPENLRQKIKDEIHKMSSIYDINFDIENY